MYGKNRRLKRILTGKKERYLCILMVHGLWAWPQNGINLPQKVTEDYITVGATSILLNPGFYREVTDVVNPEIGMFLRLGETTNIRSEGGKEIPIADN